MTKQGFIASRGLLAQDPTGRRFKVVLSVGAPYEVSADEWACAVSLDGLHERLTTVGEVHEYVYSELHRLGRRMYGYTQVFDELRQIIVEQSGVDPRLVQPEASFVYDLKMD